MSRWAILALLLAVPALAQTPPTPPARGGTGSITVPTAGQVMVGTSGGIYAPATVSGDCSMAAGGVILCTPSGNLLNTPNTWAGLQTFSGSATGPSYNAAGTNGYQIGGLNGISYTTATSAVGVLIGPYAGAVLPGGGQFSTTNGAYALESSTNIVGENYAAGMGAAIAATTAGGITAVGTGACSGITTVGNMVCIGDTAGRNYLSTQGGDILIGTGAGTDGAPTNSNWVAGTLSLQGNAGTITIGNGYVAGDVLTYTIATSNACGTVNCTTVNTASVAYTVPSTPTSASIALGVAALLNAANVKYTLGDGTDEASHNLYSFGASVADVTNHPTVIKLHFPTRWALTIGYSCAGACAGTSTITPATTGGENVIGGNSVMAYFGSVNPAYNALLGNLILTDKAVSPQFNSGVGNETMIHGISPTYNSYVGWKALNACVNCSQNVAVGSYAGYTITGNGNTVLTDQATAGQTSITSGGHNLAVGGAGTAVQSPTASNQVSVQNAIYCTGATGTGSTPSPGVCGIANAAPTATWTVGDAGGNATQGSHIAVTQTTAPVISGGGTVATLDATASDTAGTVTGGTAKTGWTLTFHVAYATTPHCVVSSPSGAAFTSYTPGTTTLVLSHTSLTGAVFTYVCTQ